jgi:chromosome segregation ATPase
MGLYKKRISSVESYAQWFRGTKRKKEKQRKREQFIEDMEAYEIALEKRMIKDSVGLLELEKELEKLEEQIEEVETAIEKSKGNKRAVKTYGTKLKDLEAQKEKKEGEIDALFGEKAKLFRQLRRALRKLRRKIKEQDKWTKQEAAEIGLEIRKMYLTAREFGKKELGEMKWHVAPDLGSANYP